MKYTVRGTFGEKQIEGIEAKLKGIRKYEFFTHDSISDTGGGFPITLSERSTGMVITSDKTREKAIRNANLIIEHHGRKRLDEVIAKGLAIIKAKDNAFDRAIHETGITLTETERNDLLHALKKHKLIK